MTMSKALTLIAIGTLLLGLIAGVVLAVLKANGTVYSIAMVLVLSAGGFVNYLATLRYGSPRRRH
jgi:hypothetical protein